MARKNKTTLAPALQLFTAPTAQDAFQEAFEGGKLDYPDANAGDIGPQVIRYGDEENDYLDVQFQNGEVMIRDGNDPTGEAHRFPEDQWRAYTGQPSREEAAAALKEQQAKDGVGLEGLKTGEQADRTKSDKEN
jgi:hypothetical protein